MLNISPKYLRFILIVILLTVVTLAAISGGSKPRKTTSACGDYRTDKTITISSTPIKVELAISHAQQANGLADRPCILPNQGMLFDFGKPGQYAIWMKGMKFPIDIVWIGADHKVVGFYNGITPSTYPDSFINKPDSPAQYVLELKNNRVNELHLTIGTPVKF